MTYAQIIYGLRAAKLDSTANSLERAIGEEQTALFEAPGGKWKKRDGGKYARESAQEFYAEDITQQLLEPLDPTPHRMLNLRRFPVVWAVAEVIRSNDLMKAHRAEDAERAKRDRAGTTTSSGDVHEGPSEE